MTLAMNQWMQPYGGKNCKLIRRYVEGRWAAAWVRDHCGHGGDDVYGDLVIFHHDGQMRPGVLRVVGVYSDTGVCERGAPTVKVLAKLGVRCAPLAKEAPVGSANPGPCNDQGVCGEEKRVDEIHTKRQEEAEQKCAAAGQGKPIEESEQGAQPGFPVNSTVWTCGPYTYLA
jgi:hypothetical protein